MAPYPPYTTSKRATGYPPAMRDRLDAKPRDPVVTYIQGGAPRQPGFRNPTNPYDTGRSGEQNTELGGGGKVEWWDYDRGVPKPGAVLNEHGFWTWPGGSSGGGHGGFQGDPILAQTQALARRQRELARSSALAKRKAAAIEYGDPSGIQGLDAETVAAARANPFSVVASMRRDYETGVRDLEEDLNKANLFYSGYRGLKLGEAATGYQARQAHAAASFRALITDIESALAQALLDADWMEMQALMGAYARAVGEALEYGIDPTATRRRPGVAAALAKKRTPARTTARPPRRLAPGDALLRGRGGTRLAPGDALFRKRG